MSDPQPVQYVLLLEAMATLGLVLWLATQPAPWRQAQLAAIAVVEQSSAPPPPWLLDQGRWLVEHRARLVESLLALVGLGALIGGVEGRLARRSDVRAGVRLTAWTCGVVGLALVPGLAAVGGLWPWPLPVRTVGSGLFVYSGIVSWCCMRGTPAIP